MIWRPKQSTAAQAYQKVFDLNKTQKEAVLTVLADMRVHFFADSTTFVEGDRDATLINEGMRTAWLRIQDMLGLKDIDIKVLKDFEDRNRIAENYQNDR